MKTNKRGFTVLELLVVIAIIAILAMIAIPNFIGRIDEAKASQELAEINAVTLAVNTYYSDNGFYPTLQGKDGTLLQPQPILGSPHNIDFSSLVPDYLATLPHFSYWWVDYQGKVYHTQESVGTVTANVFTPTVGYSYMLYKTNGTTQVLSAPYTLQAGEYVVGLDDRGIDLPKVSSNFKNALMHPESPEYSANRKPVAVITMTPNQDITVGTAITWSHTDSTDPDGDAITASEWEGKQSTYAAVGTYTVKLRVQDSQGLWSDWVSKTITVEGVLTQALSENNITTASSTYVAYPYYAVRESFGMVSSPKIEDSLGRDITKVTLGLCRYTNLRIYEYGTNLQIYYLGASGTGNSQFSFDRPVKAFYVSVGDSNRPELTVNGYSVSTGGWGASNEIYSQEKTLTTPPVKIQLLTTDSIPAGGSIAYYYSLTGKTGTWLPIQKNETISNIDTASTSIMLKAVGTAGTGGTMPGISNWTLNVVQK